MLLGVYLTKKKKKKRKEGINKKAVK